MHLFSLLSLAGSVAVANAHFLLNYPQTRGFDEDKVRLPVHLLLLEQH